MRIFARFAGIALCAVALAGASGGCGDSAGSSDPEWEKVVSAQVSGKQPVKLNLGTHPLGDRVRLAWVLSGPESPTASLTLRVIHAGTGIGYGQTVSSQTSSQTIPRKDEQAIVLNLVPGDYRIFFAQRFRPTRGPGYDVDLTVYTTHSSP
jgi:hypothetical protein